MYYPPARNPGTKSQITDHAQNLHLSLAKNNNNNIDKKK